MNSQFLGSRSSFKYLSNIPSISHESLLATFDNEDSKTKKIARNVLQMEVAYARYHQTDSKDIKKQCITKIVTKLADFKREFRSDNEAVSLVELNIYPLLRSLLMNLPQRGVGSPYYTTLYEVVVDNLAMIANRDDIADWIQNDIPMMNKLFTLFNDVKSVDSVFVLFHNILFLTEFDLRKIKLFKIVEKLNRLTFFMFIKVLTSTLFQPDSNEAPKLSDSITLKANQLPIYTINHSIILAVPSILDKAYHLLEYSMRPNFFSPSLITSPRSDVYDWGKKKKKKKKKKNEPPHTGEPPLSQAHARMILEQLNLEYRGDAVEFLKEYSRATYQADLIVFIYSLANGNRRYHVLKKLKQLGFAKLAEDMIKSLKWNVSEYEEEVNPFFIRKIQLLRIILLFFDMEATRAPFASSCSIISRHEEHLINGVERCQDSQCLKEKTSIISTLWESYERAKGIEKERSFLTCCIQTVLKSPNLNLNAYFEKKGLLKGLVNEVSSPLDQYKAFYQMNFDVLGEMIKFKLPAFIYLNNRLRANPQEFQVLMENVMANIIETNVFVRYLSLSLYHFSTQPNIEYDFENCLFNRFLEENIFKVMKLLIDSLTLDKISVDIVAQRKGQLNDYIAELKVMGQEDFVDRILELFDLWNRFYFNNTRDLVSIETSSQFKFDEILKLQVSLKVLLKKE
ncbi:hypothetical protein DFA_00908 [Cavenderia fasciculata]|uniref:Uncharacterized protein n=1 Tax=Cavenderia fasciculata TaxID=261658 RepID=F4PUG6_CACFS|nr:uncharacterized protein DFA_00908 [Cavenderia fasciculata]EGG21038.1 hypothetical protein DFA_00908 [Cavenderia fasciculata]|eukprot:XP_004358888.1 hypothetical protein DFA_00908 [Cavenderia fasciculata]